MNKLPHRIHVMNRIANRYDRVEFITTNTHVTITFGYPSDAYLFWIAYGIKEHTYGSVQMTHQQFDNLYPV